MILDYRIYVTIYAVCVLAYFGSLFASNDKWFFRLWVGSIVAGVLTGFVQFLDWLWS